MWPCSIDWQTLRFGVEIEFVGGAPEQLELLPGWIMSLDERQIDEAGEASGSELKPPPMLWTDREQIAVMLRRLIAQGATANWSCGLHVHVSLESWGEAIVLPLLDTALKAQEALRELLQTGEYRHVYCPSVTEEHRRQYAASPERESLCCKGRPQSHRCGINTAAWFDIGTVEIRYANGSLDADEVFNTIELCLRFVAAVGSGNWLPGDAQALAAAVGAPSKGYPAAIQPPRWYKERVWLEEALLPLFASHAEQLEPGGEVHHIVPTSDGIRVAIETGGDELRYYTVTPPANGWEMKKLK